MDLEILEPDPSTYDELVELRLKRQPRLRRAQAEWPLVHAEELAYLHLRAAYVPKASTGTAELVG